MKNGSDYKNKNQEDLESHYQKGDKIWKPEEDMLIIVLVQKIG